MDTITLINALQEVHDRIDYNYRNDLVTDIPEVLQDLKSIIKELDGHV